MSPAALGGAPGGYQGVKPWLSAYCGGGGSVAGSKEDTWRVLRESRGGGYPGGRGYLGGGSRPAAGRVPRCPPRPAQPLLPRAVRPRRRFRPPRPAPRTARRKHEGPSLPAVAVPRLSGRALFPGPVGSPTLRPPPRAPPPAHPGTAHSPAALGPGQTPPAQCHPPPSPRAMTVTLFFHCARGAPGGAQSRTPPPFPDPNPTPEGEGRGGAPPIRTAEGDSGGANNSAERSPRSAPPPPHFPPQHRDTAPRGAPPGPTGAICGAAPARQRHAATPPPHPLRAAPRTAPWGPPRPAPPARSCHGSAARSRSRVRAALRGRRGAAAAGSGLGGKWGAWGPRIAPRGSAPNRAGPAGGAPPLRQWGCGEGAEEEGDGGRARLSAGSARAAGAVRCGR